MGHPRIVLTGVSPKLQGLQWESGTLLRIGRQGNLDIALDDPSIARQHAEVFTTGQKWLLRDLAGQDRHPTLVNGMRVNRSECHLQLDDVVQVGNLAFQVASLEVSAPAALPVPLTPRGSGVVPTGHLKTTGSFVRVQAATHRSWDQAIEAVTNVSAPEPRRDQHLLTLLRASHHLCHIATLDELLRSVLGDAIQALNAQRGSILLEDPATGQMQLQLVLAPDLPAASQRCYSKTLAERCFRDGESLLCRDASAEADLAMAMSVRKGSMASLICALLRSPRSRLGVLQLDRGPLQDPFDEDDFYLADAIAASVAVGIESARLIEQQRDQFIQTVTSLARTVEVRDPYTWGHARRVTDYSLLLADELRVSAAERYQIQIGTPLHDIGKIGVEDAVLRKPGKLTADEFEQMKQHTVLGAAILESIVSLAPMIPIVRHHHERWDGKGYPDGLPGPQTAPTARIVAVADAFDAMTSTRPYRPAIPVERAFAELAEKAGTQFDPHCIRAFLAVRPAVEALLRRK